MLSDLKHHSPVQCFALDVCPYCLTFPVLTPDSRLTPEQIVKTWAIHKSGELAREFLYFAQASDAYARGDLPLAKATTLEAIQHITAESPRLHLLLGKIALSLGDKDLFREAKAFLEFLQAAQSVQELLTAEKCSQTQN
ncbi:MAG TPA: hypothetical protein VJN89_03045 [Candidatus Acidoferrum sp.]|nr:hypothetical protein [Candidatus Acidoferrum sp.]